MTTSLHFYGPSSPHFWYVPDPKEEINRQLAPLTSKAIYNFLHEHYANSTAHQLEDINPENLLEPDSCGQTTLHWAAVKGDVEVASFIIRKTEGALLLSKTTIDEYTPLHLAVLGGNDQVVNLLVLESKRFGLTNFVGAADIHNQTALHLAASKGKFEVCQKLYPEMSPTEISLQIKDRLQTVLHFAVQGGHYQIAELLLSNDEAAKELLRKSDKYGQSVLHWAASKSSDQGKALVDLLIEKARNLPLDLQKAFFLARKTEDYTALHLAAHSDSNDSIKSLIKATKNTVPEFIPAVDQYGQTALHWAAGKGNFTASTYLCEAMTPEEINIQVKDRKQTALHFAVQGGHIKVIELLIAKGADVGLKDSNEWTALDWAQNYLKTDSKDAIVALLKNHEQS